LKAFGLLFSGDFGF